MNVRGINMATVGYLGIIPALLMSIGMMISGRIIDKIGSKAKFVVTGSTFIYGICLYLITTAGSITMIIVFQSIAMTCASFTYSFVFTLPHRFMKQKVVGTAFGMINFGGQAAGIFAPTIMGIFISASGGSYTSAFLFLAVSCVIASVISITLPNLKQQADSSNETIVTDATLAAKV